MASIKYWPFPVAPLNEQTAQHKKEIQFLRAATQLGYRAYMFGSNLGAEGTGGRLGEIVHRGGNRQWEIWLTHSAQLAGKKRVDDFDSATTAVLCWLQGEDVGRCFSGGAKGPWGKD